MFPRRVVVIGCGGGGCFDVPKLLKLRQRLTLVDGDKFEEKNLDRQLFSREYLGMNKAEALAKMYDPAGELTDAVPEFFHAGLDIGLSHADVVFCGVDNQPGRREVLSACDQFGCQCCIGANEYTDAEAYWYMPEWRNTPNDPRVFYPAILTDLSGDPLAPRGCTGAAQEERPQLVLANDWSSGMMLHLFWFYTQVVDGLSREAIPQWPVHHKVNKFRWRTILHGEKK